MFRFKLILPVLAALTVTISAAEREKTLGFAGAEVGKLPSGFRAVLSGEGRPGQWQIMNVDAPSAFPAVTGNALTTSQQQVLAQVSRDPTDERFPVLIYDEETFTDFTFSAQVRMIGGAVEQMAGLAFRIQDEKNYYVIRANAMNGNFRFYKFVNGERSNPIGPEIPIERGAWREISVQCQGNQLQFRLDGKAVMPALTDTSFASGKVGFWTKSDSESQFANARIRYVPREILAVTLVNEAMKKFDRLRGLKLYGVTSDNPQLRVLAASNPESLGKPGGTSENECLKTGKSFHSKSRSTETTSVLLPLKDRNGDVAAVVEITMDSFFGQTEATAITRAMSVVRSIEPQVVSRSDLVE